MTVSNNSAASTEREGSVGTFVFFGALLFIVSTLWEVAVQNGYLPPVPAGWRPVQLLGWTVGFTIVLLVTNETDQYDEPSFIGVLFTIMGVVATLYVLVAWWLWPAIRVWG